MMHDDWVDQKWVHPDEAAEGQHDGPARKMSLDGWQAAGVFLLSVLITPALIKGTSEAGVQCLGTTFLSSPLLAWLLIPFRPSDDLFDQATHGRAELMDTLAIVLIWTWPCTCVLPLLAVARWLLKLLPHGS